MSISQVLKAKETDSWVKAEFIDKRFQGIISPGLTGYVLEQLSHFDL